MQSEGWEMVPRKDRPQPEQLEGYERKHEFDPDYTLYRRERSDWIYDYRREEEEKRERDNQGRTPLPGHDEENFLQQSRNGFDPENFDLEEVIGVAKSRPQH